jgi:urease accessory protein
MLHLREKLKEAPATSHDRQVTAVLTLTCADRRRSRLRATLDDGQEVALLLPRGTLLRDGDHLFDSGQNAVVLVRAAPEQLSVARADDRHLLCRACYHLGNRHVPVEIGVDWLAYEHDHVLDDMVRALGLTVGLERRAFEPEAGGYGHRHEEGHAGKHEHHESSHHAV